MSKFDILTKYIPLIQTDCIGEWVIDKENDGTPEHPIQMPFVGYSEMVRNFIRDENGLEWRIDSMKDADLSNLNAQCVLALLMGAVRAERFCDGHY